MGRVNGAGEGSHLANGTNEVVADVVHCVWIQPCRRFVAPMGQQASDGAAALFDRQLRMCQKSVPIQVRAQRRMMVELHAWPYGIACASSRLPQDVCA